MCKHIPYVSMGAVYVLKINVDDSTNDDNDVDDDDDNDVVYLLGLVI